ncbi:MAG: hypothetical protein H6579_09530 [Chitinophagales bacterium]|nr:hypothetical protein [Chitinophagales bacterium]
MKIGKLVVVFALWLAVAGLGYWLYKIIQDPVQFEKDYSLRFEATTNRMEDIRLAQSYYFKATGKYAGDLDALIASIKNDLITEVVVNGNADDTAVVTTYDTLRYYAIDKIVFSGTNNLDSLKYIPYSGGETFDLQADQLKLQRVEVPVYEVVATKAKYLKNLNEEYLDLKDDLVLGSVTMATEKASWE